MELGPLNIIFITLGVCICLFSVFLFYKRSETEKFANELQKTDYSYRIGDSLRTNGNPLVQQFGEQHKDLEMKEGCTEGFSLDTKNRFLPCELANKVSKSNKGSIVDKMVQERDKNFFMAFTEAIKSIKCKPVDGAVLHLRLGDKLEQNGKKDSHNYELPTEEEIKNKLLPYLKKKNVKEITILCGLGADKHDIKDTVSYLEQVVSDARAAGFKVKLHHGSPDEDMCLLANSSIIVLTSGGYTLPALAMRKRKEAITFSEDKESAMHCYTEPGTDYVKITKI